MEGPQDWADTDVLQGIMADDNHDKGFDPSLDLHLGSEPSYLNQWSSNPYYFSRGEQDAWNPLLVTGVPTSSMSHMNVSVPDEYCFSHHPYSEPSENGSQYLDSYPSADSGYGATSCATQSVVASSYTESSPAKDVTEGTFDSHSASRESYSSEFVGSPSMFEASVKCDHRSCLWVGKCPSDKRKHEARHRKLFKCDEPNCPRKEGFGTINDLARHKKCVHNKEPERGPKMTYLCFGMNCPRPDKRWPRLDNFKQHLNRMHHDEDGEVLLKRSMDWYEKVIRPGKRTKTHSTRADSEFDVQEDVACAQSTPDHEPEIKSTSQNTEIFTFGATSDTQQQTATGSDTSQFPAFGSFGLAGQEAAADRTTKSEGSITDAADNLINAMTKMMNNRGRRSSQNFDEGIDLDSDSAQLSQPQRQMLQKVLSAALERLADNETTQETEKQDWFQCDACPKKTRLRCEMKKHQKRHERPYGCTFPHCAKSFGSKADWKRHEISQHLNVPSWLCTAHDLTKGPCERLFYRPDIYMQHLHQHGMLDHQIAAATNNRLDLNGQSDFWCGFCNRRVGLKSQGAAALDERFNHIDIEHFKKGERGQDWASPSVGTTDAKLDKGRKRKFAVV
ncbi:zinc finger protein [Penicillium brevicompactum]